MSEQKTVTVKCPADNSYYIDLAAVLSAFGNKQYHQVTRKGDPLCYSGTIRAAADDAGLSSGMVTTACNNWVTKNAIKKTAVGWKKQLTHAGVRVRDLPSYGRNFRTSLEAAGQADINRTGGSGTIVVRGLRNNMVPVDATGSAVFSGYTDSGDRAVTYDSANTITQLAITDADGITTEAHPCLLGVGTGIADFMILDEYLGSRRNVGDYEAETPGPSSTNKMTSLFGVAEEMSDDIIGAVEDFGDNRPYDNGTNADTLVGWGLVGSSPSSLPSGATSYLPASSVHFEAPLGLLKMLDAKENAKWIIDIHAIYEM